MTRKLTTPPATRCQACGKPSVSDYCDTECRTAAAHPLQGTRNGAKPNSHAKARR